MATCPKCGANSRLDSSFTVSEVYVQQDGSLAGVQAKFPAAKRLMLSHSCGWFVLGYIDGSDFVASSKPT